jgi:hypothetical protein
VIVVVAAVIAAAAAVADVPSDAVVHSLNVTGDVMVQARVDKKRALSVKGKVEARLDGDTLVVTAPARADGERPVITLVVADGIDAVTAAGPARVEIAGVNGKSLSIAAHGAAAVTASGKIASLVVTGDGTSHVDADDVAAAAVDVKLAEAARAEVKATDSLVCNLERASRLTVKGNPKSVKKTVGGVAKLVLAP